jgi:hypothetical protein
MGERLSIYVSKCPSVPLDYNLISCSNQYSSTHAALAYGRAATFEEEPIMHKIKSGYRHRQFDISRGSYIGTEDSISGWYVDHKDSDTLDRRGPGFRTLREAIENIDEVVAAHLHCPHCDLWIGDKEWRGLPSVDHDIDECHPDGDANCTQHDACQRRPVQGDL